MASILTNEPHVVLSAGSLLLDVAAHQLRGPAGSVALKLSPYLVLRALMRRPGVVVSLTQLIEATWEDPDREPGNPERAMRQRVVRARAAMNQVGVPGSRLRSAFTIGYVIEGEPSIIRAYTPRQAAALDRLMATHPDRAAVLELSAC